MRHWQLLSVALLVTVALLLRAEYAPVPAQVYLFKPLATILVIALAFPAARDGGDRYAQLVAMGLLFSLAGDVFLMLPRDRFIAGLVSFLVAHLCYIGAFTRDGGFSRQLTTALPLVAIGAVLLSLLWPFLGPLRLPVLVYMLVILTMAWQALERSRLDAHDGAWWAAVGAVLFVASDAALALVRFRADFTGSRAFVLGTYYLAQWMIATSALVRAGQLAR
ncbi:MAG: lysoplasmalogenase [Gemmatimonadaceae bacterium]|nr:lysoplasmalogenase [Gemmatimonadaceae bacterium]